MRISSVIIALFIPDLLCLFLGTHPEKMVFWMKEASNTLLLNNSEEQSDGGGRGEDRLHLHVSKVVGVEEVWGLVLWGPDQSEQWRLQGAGVTWGSAAQGWH